MSPRNNTCTESPWHADVTSQQHLYRVTVACRCHLATTPVPSHRGMQMSPRNNTCTQSPWHADVTSQQHLYPVTVARRCHLATTPVPSHRGINGSPRTKNIGRKKMAYVASLKCIRLKRITWYRNPRVPNASLTLQSLSGCNQAVTRTFVVQERDSCLSKSAVLYKVTCFSVRMRMRRWREKHYKGNKKDLVLSYVGYIIVQGTGKYERPG